MISAARRPATTALAVAAAWASVVAATVPVAASAAPSGTAEDEPLRAAGHAAEHLSFVGVLELQWWDGRVEQRETLLVQGANGSVMVRGDTSVLASPQQRLVEKAGGTWSLLWPGGQDGGDRPSPKRKYTLAVEPGPAVSNRPSRVVEVRANRSGALVERLYLDQQTELLLRREQFEGGIRVRTIEFETLTIGNGGPAPVVPERVVDAAPKVIPAAKLPSSVAAPGSLAGGYERVGIYRRSGVVQAVYSDGLYDLSIFEQPGRLDHDGLPADGRVTVRDRRGWHYRWPGGHVVLWDGAGVIYTAVSDAPLEQVLAAVRSLPEAKASVSLIGRLRQVCRALIQPLAV